MDSSSEEITTTGDTNALMNLNHRFCFLATEKRALWDDRRRPPVYPCFPRLGPALLGLFFRRKGDLRPRFTHTLQIATPYTKYMQKFIYNMKLALHIRSVRCCCLGVRTRCRECRARTFVVCDLLTLSIVFLAGTALPCQCSPLRDLSFVLYQNPS